MFSIDFSENVSIVQQHVMNAATRVVSDTRKFDVA